MQKKYDVAKWDDCYKFLHLFFSILVLYIRYSLLVVSLCIVLLVGFLHFLHGSASLVMLSAMKHTQYKCINITFIIWKFTKYRWSYPL